WPRSRTPARISAAATPAASPPATGASQIMSARLSMGHLDGFHGHPVARRHQAGFDDPPVDADDAVLTGTNAAEVAQPRACPVMAEIANAGAHQRGRDALAVAEGHRYAPPKE